MPTYDYGCKACGHEFEREQRISEKPIKKCPACGKLQAKRLISRTSFVLKGGGWYNEGYASGKPDAKPSADAGDAADSGSTEAKSDSGGGGDKPKKKSKAGKPSGKKAKGGGKEAA